MAKCGIKKYDEMPSRVGWKDVDAARFAISEKLSKIFKLEIEINEIKKDLDFTYKKWKGDKK